MSDATLVEQLNFIIEDCQRGKEARYYLHDKAHATFRDVELACSATTARIAELKADQKSASDGRLYVVRQAVLEEREAFIDVLKRRRNGSYNDWSTRDEQRLIDTLIADIRARPAP